MAEYTPPSSDAVDFAFSEEYSPPASDSLEFAFVTIEAPESVSVAATRAAEIDLTWTNTDTYDEVRIYRDTEPDIEAGPGTLAATVAGSSESYTDTGLVNGREYFYQVAGVVNSQVATSDEISGTTVLPAAGPDTLVTSVEREVTIEWSLEDNNPDGDLTIRRDGSAIETVSDLGATEYTDTGLLDGEEYEYDLVRDTGDATATSDPETGVTHLPDAEGLSLSPGGSGDLDVEWNAVLNNGEYRLEWRLSDETEWADSTTVDNTEQSHTISGLLDGREYDVRLRTQSAHATGSYTTATETTVLPDITALSSTGNDHEINLGWTASHGNGETRIEYTVAPESSWSTYAVVGYDVDSEVIDGLADGTEYNVRVRAETADVNGTYATGDATTTVPDIDAFSAEGGDREVSLEWTPQHDNGETAVDYRETGASSWINHDVVDHETSEAVIGSLRDGTQYDIRVRPECADATGDWQATSTTTVLPAATGLTTSNVDTDEFTATWDDVLNAGQYRLRWKQTSESGFDSANETTVSFDTDQSHTVGGLLDGQAYDVELRTETDDVDGGWVSVVETTLLPDAEGLSLDGTPPSELDVEWDQVLNNGQYRLEFRDDAPDGDHPPYQAETTVAHDGTLEHTIEDVLDGEQFSVRIRTETDDVTGDWLSAEEITKLYSPDTPTFTAVGETEVTLEWTNNSLFDGSNQIYRRRLYADDVGQWRLVGTAASDAESFTDDTVSPDTEYEYYVRAQTPWIGTDSDTSDAVVTDDIGLEHRAVSPRGWHAEIERPDGTIVTPAILSDGTQFQPTLNAQPSATINVPRDEAYLLEQYEGAPMRLYKDGQRRAVDELEDVVIETDRDELVGMGATELEQEVEIDVDDRQAHALVAELIGENTDLVANIDAFEASIEEGVVVADPSTTTELEEVLGEWPFGEDMPVRVEGNQIEILDTCDIVDLSGSATDDQYSGGSADDNSSIQSTHNFEYTIPAGEVGLVMRNGIIGDDPTDIQCTLNTEEIPTPQPNSSSSPYWVDLSSGVPAVGIQDADFVAFEESGGGEDPHIADCVAVFDRRFHDPDDFSDSVHEPGGYLNRPYRKPPEGVELETVAFPQFRRAVAGSLSVETNDPNGILELELSADNGQTWASAEDAELLEVDFDEPAPYLRARLTLGAIVDDPQSATPRYGYEAQTLESLEITADFDDTPLVINHQDRGELGEVLANIADQTEAVYEVWQDGDDTRFEWTWPEQRSTTRSDAISDYSVTKHTRRTLSCTVRGATQPVRGEEITVDTLGESYALGETDVVRGKEEIRDSGDERLRTGLDYELHGADGEIRILEGSSVDAGETLTIDYDYTVTGTYEHADYGGDTRQKRTVSIPAARSERACEQAAKVIVDEASVPRWEADVTIAYEDVQDIRLSDTLDIDAVPGDAEVVRELGDEGSQSGVSLRLGNRKAASERVSQIQSQLSSASDLV